jgi:hypothetical protein
MNRLRKSIEFLGLFGFSPGSSLAFVDGKRHVVDVLHVMMRGGRSARQVPCGGFLSDEGTRWRIDKSPPEFTDWIEGDCGHD